MIDVSQIISLHREMLLRWHQQEIDNPYHGLLGMVCRQHRYNFLLWHEEDMARSPDESDQRIAQVKRKIDGYNQLRNDWIEKIDDHLTERLSQLHVVAPSDAALGTETPAAAIDRLSILSLRIYHLEEQLWRVDVTAAHTKSVEAKLAICLEQQADLSTSLAQLLQAIFSGHARHKTYRQLKMYNDPALNPYLYQAQNRRAS